MVLAVQVSAKSKVYPPWPYHPWSPMGSQFDLISVLYLPPLKHFFDQFTSGFLPFSPTKFFIVTDGWWMVLVNGGGGGW